MPSSSRPPQFPRDLVDGAATAAVDRRHDRVEHALCRREHARHLSDELAELALGEVATLVEQVHELLEEALKNRSAGGLAGGLERATQALERPLHGIEVEGGDLIA